MSEAGLTLLLNRAESTLDLWEIVWSNTGEAPHAHYRDLAEASREARDRLSLPPRESWKARHPRPPAAPVRPTEDLPALRAECRRTIEQAMVIENRYPGGPITDPDDEAEVTRLLKEAVALEERIEAAQAADARRRRLLKPTYCTFDRTGPEVVLFTPRDEAF